MADTFVGVQISANTIFDEGIEQCLDLLQGTAGVNALFIFTHSTYDRGRAVSTLAPDHGVPAPDFSRRNLPRIWVRTHEEYYRGTSLRHARRLPEQEYAGREVLEELAEPAARRGVKLYSRILGVHNADGPNWPKVVQVDVYGRPCSLPCFNNPDYRAFCLSTVEDLFRSYPLAGFKYGPEVVGPLSRLFFQWGWGTSGPACFCEHCRARGRAEGIDVERAREGFRRLHASAMALGRGEAPPTDGAFVTFLRTLLKYPEVLAWEHLYYVSKEEVNRLLSGAIKTIRPEAEFGMHVHHPATAWDLIYRAHVDYAELAEYCDWIKPVLYHDVCGPRTKGNLERMHESLMGEASREQLLGLLYGFIGLDAAKEPGWDELASRGFSPEWTYRETRRCVDAVRGRARVYAGVGIDVPGLPSEPAGVYNAVGRAFEAGADGLLISREYNEMRVPNLEAVGRALRDAGKA